MATGTVKWFNNAKGYGFVLAQGSNEDLFIHYSSIQMEGYKSLKAGQEIEYDVQEGPKGKHAVNIRYATAADTTASPGAPETPLVSNDNGENLHLNPMHDMPHASADTTLPGHAATSSEPREVEVEAG